MSETIHCTLEALSLKRCFTLSIAFAEMYNTKMILYPLSSNASTKWLSPPPMSIIFAFRED